MKKKILHFLLGGVCVILHAGCGSETDVQELDGIKIDMQATTEPTKSPMEVPAVEPSDVPATEPPEVPAQEATESPDIETTTPDDFYKMTTNKTAREVEDFARLVKATLLEMDFEKMSELVAYPITIDGERIESQEEFLNMDYGSKVNPDFLKRVEEASCEQMFCNWQGIMLGEIGSVWIAEVLDGSLESMGLRVIALNDLVNPAADVTPEEIAETRMAYQQVLTTVMNDLKLPDGTELYYDSFHAFSQNKFAIHDVDGDGREELILSYVTGPMAVQGKYVFGYNPETETVYEQGRDFSMVFYEDGIIKARSSHNHGRGDKLWPYTVYYYSPITDDYRYGVHVDSWEKDYYGDTAQGASFPADVDTDGDGIVYYLLPYDDYSYDSKDALDGKEYNEWYERQFGSREIIKPTYYELTKENIEEVSKKNGTAE